MTSARKFIYWFPAVLWALVIFGFSAHASVATSQIHWQDFIVKKTAHWFVYSVLAILTYRALKHTTYLNKAFLIMLTLSLTILYAVTDEFHQTFTPGREPTFRDVVIDSIGISSGLYLAAKKLNNKI